ncbi:MAG: type II secretion system F family protein [Methanomassiliicoccales archaeon]
MSGGERKPSIFSQIEMRFSTYILMVFASLVVFGIVLPTLILVTFGEMLASMALAVYLVPIIAITAVAALPLLLVGRKRKEIEHLMPLFVTRMAALSTSDMQPEKLFHMLSTCREYGQLAKDSGKIYRLVKDYHMPVAEACRFIAARSASHLEADFFSRLSHAIDVGERLERFLKNEQDVIMDEYTLKCEAAIKDMDFLKEIFTSIVISLVFIAVFISIVPLLAPQNIKLLVMSIIAIFASVELLFLLLMYMRVPKDTIWYQWSLKWKEGFMTDADRMLIASIVIAVACVVFLALFLSIIPIPIPLYISSIFLPLLIPGMLIMKEERKIERRDNIYGAFLRALGRSGDVTGQTMTESVKKLALHKFGPLTEFVRNLERRLSMRISTMDSWRHFASEANSNLIKKFGEMYIHSTINGARPEPTSLFISNNMSRILAVRKKRLILAGNYVGILYGIMVAVSFTLFSTVGILEYMGNMISSLIPPDADIMSFGILSAIYEAKFAVADLTMMVYAVIVVHAAVSSVILVILKGGHLAGAVVYFVSMVWIGVATSVVVDALITGMLVV